MNEPPDGEQDRRRKHALIVFQVLIYGFLFGMFVLQMHMRSVRPW